MTKHATDKKNEDTVVSRWQLALRRLPLFISTKRMWWHIQQSYTMKQKILSALKNKYAHLGLSREALDGVASVLEKTIKSDEEIETAVSGVEGMLKVFQSEADRERTNYNALKAAKEEIEKKLKEATPPTPPKEDPKPFDAEAFRAEILETMRKERESATQNEQKAAQRKAEITAKAKEYGIPETLIGNFAIADDANVDDFFKGVKQTLADAGFEFSEPPTSGGGIRSDAEGIASLINKETENIVKSQNK